MSNSQPSRAQAAFIHLFDRLQRTSLGRTMRNWGVSPSYLAKYMEKHPDVKQAVESWFADLEKLIEMERQARKDNGP